MSDAIKEGRKTILFLLTICLLWLLTENAVRTHLVTRGLIEDMAVWALLREKIEEAVTQERSAASDQERESNFVAAPVGGRFNSYEVAFQQRNQTPRFSSRKLSITPPWQPELVMNFGLRRISAPQGLRIFAIESDFSALTRSRYVIGTLHRDFEPFVSPPNSDRYQTSSAYLEAVFEHGLDGPRSKVAVLNILTSRGWKGMRAADIRSTDAVVAATIRDLRDERFQIVGLPVTPLILPLAIGALLVLGAFNLLGPCLALYRQGYRRGVEVWIMTAAPVGGRFGPIRIIQILAIFVATVVPVWTSWGLWSMADEFESGQGSLVRLACAGGLLAACATIGFGWLLLTRGEVGKQVTASQTT